MEIGNISKLPKTKAEEYTAYYGDEYAAGALLNAAGGLHDGWPLHLRIRLVFQNMLCFGLLLR